MSNYIILITAFVSRLYLAFPGKLSIVHLPAPHHYLLYITHSYFLSSHSDHPHTTQAWPSVLITPRLKPYNPVRRTLVTPPSHWTQAAGPLPPVTWLGLVGVSVFIFTGGSTPAGPPATRQPRRTSDTELQRSNTLDWPGWEQGERVGRPDDCKNLMKGITSQIRGWQVGQLIILLRQDGSIPPPVIHFIKVPTGWSVWR